MRKNLVLVAGDTHCFFEGLGLAIKKYDPLLVLQCGDFGYWPNYLKKALPEEGFRNSKGQLVPVHFCDGNHEHHWALRELLVSRAPPYEVASGVFFQPRGSLLTLPDGRRTLFCGGADSIDKHLRVEGRDWFPEEVLTEEDYRGFPEVPSVDIVVSHAAPACLPLPPPLKEDKHLDPSRAILDKVLLRYRPELWYCGHYHVAFAGECGNCRIQALDCATRSFWLRRPNPAGVALLEMRGEAHG